jgi:DNA-binding response OmpR family regulator
MSHGKAFGGRGKTTHLGLARRVSAGQGGRVTVCGSATILVLEENAAVQELVEQALRDLGHRILSTQNTLEALEVVRRVRVDVLVAGHLVQDRLNAVVNELRSLQPQLSVVTICAQEDELDQVDLGAALSPPFSLSDLRAVITAGLEHRVR